MLFRSNNTSGKSFQIGGVGGIWGRASDDVEYITNANFDGSVWTRNVAGYATRHIHAAGVYSWATAPSGAAGSTFTTGQFSTNMTLSADGTFRVKGAGTAGSTDAFQVNGSAPASAVSVGSDGDMTINGLTVGKGNGSVSSNTACGNGALASANGGISLDAFGQGALAAGPSGNFNSAFGRYAGSAITSGSNNVAVGSRSEEHTSELQSH